MIDYSFNEKLSVGRNTYTLYNTTLIFSVLYLIRLSTLWEPYHDIARLFLYVSLLSGTFLLGNSINKYKDYEKVIIGVLLLLSIFVGRRCDALYPMYLLFVLIICAKGLSFDRLLIVFFYTSMFFCLMNIVGSSLGFIKTYTYIDVDRDLFFETTSFMKRYSFGYDWTTDFASHVFFISLTYWLVKKGHLSFFFISIYIALSFFILYFTGTRASALCIFLLAMISIIIKRSDKSYPKHSKYIWFFLLSTTPLFAMISLYVVIYFDPTNMNWFLLNAFSSGRLAICQDSFYEHGMTWLGQEIKMIGMGNFHLVRGAEYNYIDISYIQYFVIKGVVVTILLIMCYVWIGIKSYKANNFALAVAISLSAFFGLFTQFHFEISYCPLLLATFANVDQKSYYLNRIKNLC